MPKHYKSAHSRQVASTEHITIHCCVSGSGSTLPPMIIFKKSFPGGPYSKDGPDQALYGHQKSGFMDSELFVSWMKKLFIPKVKPTAEKPVLLLLDGHVSHCSIPLIDVAKENHVILLALAPHMTHLCQPCDVSVFKGFKAEVTKLIKGAQTVQGNLFVSKRNVPRMIKGPFEKAMDHIKNGF